MSHDVGGEYYSVYTETSVRKARKPHKCDACEEMIPTGATYVRVFVVFDSKPEWLVRCQRCQKIHEHLRGLNPGETWPAERLDCGESYRDHWGEDPPPEIQALAFALPGDAQ